MASLCLQPHCESYNTVFTFSVTLSADADPAPGGYVVPEGGSITFTCNYSLSDSRGGVLWKVDLRVSGGKVTDIASQGVAAWLPQVTSPDTTALANPASLTINNITWGNNQSFVECFREGSGLSNVTFIVEGEATINIQNVIIAVAAIHTCCIYKCMCHHNLDNPPKFSAIRYIMSSPCGFT